MLIYVSFHRGPHCLQRQKISSENEMSFYLEIITCDPQYTQWTVSILEGIVLSNGMV